MGWMKKIGLVLLVMVLVCGWMHAQKKGQALVDSLEAALARSAPDTQQVNLLTALSFEYAYINPSIGLQKGKAALDLAMKLNWPKGVADAHRVLGSNYANQEDYPKALEYEYNALRLYEHLDNAHMQAMMHQNIAIVHRRSRNFPKALEYNRKALRMFQELEDRNREASVLSNMANVYSSMGEPDKVLEFNQKALDIYQATGNRPEVARMVGNIANFHAGEGNFSQAMVHYFDALRKEKALGNDNGVTRNMGNIGETYLDIAKAWDQPDSKIRPDSLIPAGKAANLARALDYLQTTISRAKAMGMTGFQEAYGEVLSEAYQMSGRPEEALAAYQDYIKVRDSIYDVEKLNDAARLEMEYEFGKREDSVQYAKRITDIQLIDEHQLRTTQLIYFIIGLALVIVFSIFLFNRWRVTQRQKVIIEKEKQRSEELLLNILPAETAQELKEKGHSDARLIEHVTVLFTDFQGFTSISEQLPPEKLVAEINECFSAFDLIMEKYGVEKIKTIGDAYMAAGGLPTSNNTHAVDVVHAALEIQEFMVRWAAKMRAAGEPYFEIRIGINTGPVVAGIVGIKKFQYDIWGDTVNTASRMESGGEVGKVNISASTFELVKDRFHCVHRGKIEAKGKGEIDMYFVEA
jgi:adenylate cyclase